MQRPEIITFDCYGTLIDWNHGIVDALAGEGARQGRTAAPEAILAAYHRAEPRAQSASYRAYRDVLTMLEAAVAAELGWRAPAEAGYLADSLPSWPPFADTNPALARLAAGGFRLGILSNIDDDLLAATRQHFSVDFDLLVTAQQVRSYKPAPAHFERALEHVANDPSRLLHVAQSYFHDVRPARAKGIRTVWINRLAESEPVDGPTPTAVLAAMSDFDPWLTAQLADEQRADEPA